MSQLATPRMVGEWDSAECDVPRGIGLAGCLLAVLIGMPEVCRAENLGLKVADGFVVTQYADDQLSHDVFAMTIDSHGNVVVSGPGYVRTLLDTNGDGRADTSQTYVDGPASGAQGLCFFGPDLICTGDSGLLRYKDRNRDGRADGAPDVFLRAKAGSEHDIHAVRKGPDGWWYVIAGNKAEIDERYITLPTSPVRRPQAGTMLRFKPDLSGGEVVAHGMRNAYDFDFSSLGDLYTFDSDGERDVSLPWYQPTRVFHITPGSHLGWHSNSRINPSDYFDMPPTLAEFGRSSPTGVACYRHQEFPAAYQGALFVLDWTFGRMWALPLQEQGAVASTQPVEFLTAEGEYGFAPTDVEVGRDGALYVCIGGRGTRGGVYRIQPAGPQTKPWDPQPATIKEKLDVCLQAPQPLSSWSRAIWEPLAAELRGEAFINAALEKQRPAMERIRAVEILTEKFGGLDSGLIAALSEERDAALRSRVAWSIGRTHPASPAKEHMQPFLADQHPQVARAALEALAGAEPTALDELTTEVGNQLAHSDPYVRQAASRALARCTTDSYQKAAAAAISHGWGGAIPVAAAYSARHPGFQNYPLEIGVRALRSPSQSLDLKADAARLIELALGDMGAPAEFFPAAYESYTSREDLTAHEGDLDLLRLVVSRMYPTGHASLDRELERLAAMVRPSSSDLLAKLLSRITDQSSPVDDLHRLIVVSRIRVAPDAAQRQIIARTLTRLEIKVEQQGLHLDSSWGDSVRDVYEGLIEQDADFPVAVLEHPDFGLPGHVQFVSEMPPERFEDVLGKFLHKIQTVDNYRWNSDVVFLLNASEDPQVGQMLRSKFDDYSLRPAIALSLAEDPAEEDRSYFIRGLESAQMETLLECIKALALLRASQDPAENVMLVRTLRRLGSEDEERQARDQVVEVLRQNLRLSFGYQLAQNGNPQREAIDQWTAAVKERFPEEFARQSEETTEDLAQLESILATVPWDSGDAQRGALLFQQRACVQCHGGRQALGPDLTGVTGRFSRKDLFTAIIFPHRDVSPRYQTTQIATTEGHVHTGLIVYEYADALVLRDAQNRSFRLSTSDIEERRVLSKSLMPSGLLKDLGPADYADLYSYLRQISLRTALRPE